MSHAPAPDPVTCEDWVFPPGETHLPAWMHQRQHRVDGRLTYQYDAYAAACLRVHQHRVAIDVGAHIGLFSYWMARDFAVVHAFEPLAAHECYWRQNVPARDGVSFHRVALGDRSGWVWIQPGQRSSGDAAIALDGRCPPDDARAVRLTRLDDYDVREVDLVKIDCEGFEPFVLRGGEAMLRRDRPVVLVEQKHAARYGLPRDAAVTYLASLGARPVAVVKDDYIVTW